MMKTPRMLRFTLPGVIAAILFAHAPMAQTKDAAGGKGEANTGNPALLLANVWTPAIDPTGWWMSEKYDGLRGYWDGKKLWSRNGNALHAPDYFLAELPADIALDGELWMGRGKFEETMSTVLSQTPDERWRQVRFMVFDAPQAKGMFEQRTQFVKATLPAKNEFVKPVPQERCTGAAQLIAERDRIVKLGGEGLMLRKPESDYEVGRSPTLLKVKPHDDAEATVTAHLPGKGKHAGKLGSLRVRTADGRDFSIGNGFTDAQRESPPPIGAIVTYRFRGRTSKGTPRFPTFLRARKD
jgi:DNA ligase-1